MVDKEVGRLSDDIRLKRETFRGSVEDQMPFDLSRDSADETAR